MFIPRTPGGKLITQLREIENNLAKVSNKTIRLVEDSSLKLREALCKGDSWEQVHCGRNNCTTCPLGGPRICRTNNVVYQNICLPCKDLGKYTR